MGRQLTARHSELFERQIPNPYGFIRDIYQYGKASELVSFMVWELIHRLRLFPKERYLKFDEHKALVLGNQSLEQPQFGEELTSHFSSRGLHLSRSAHNWKLLFINNDREMFGCMHADDHILYRSDDSGRTVVLAQQFPEPIKSIFISSKNTILVCVKGALYRSSDGGSSFEKTLTLGSSESFFRHNNAMTETPDGTLVAGEYGNVWEKNGWRKLAYLYFSTDNGKSWVRSDFLIRQGINKHVHLVKYSKSLNRLFVADGDNKKKLWISDPLTSSVLDITWHPVTKFHLQMGGYTSVVETNGTMLFGTDYQGGTNFTVATNDGRKFTKSIVPDPYRRSPIDNMVQRRSKAGVEVWANLPYSTANTKCLLMYTSDGGRSWNRVIEYSRATHKVWLISSSRESANELYLSIEDQRSSHRAVYRISD